MTDFLPKEIEETEKEIGNMKKRGANETIISNWQEGLRQKKSELIYLRLAKEALDNIEATGKGAE